jgi:hypothetical protein
MSNKNKDLRDKGTRKLQDNFRKNKDWEHNKSKKQKRIRNSLSNF